MRLTFVILFLAYSLNIFGQPTELDMCNCWDSLFQAKNSNYSESFLEMEKSFISKAYLKKANAKSYFSLMNSIEQKGDYYITDIKFDPLLIQGFEQCFLLNECRKSVFIKIREINSIISNYKDINPSIVFSDLRNMLNKQDLKSIYMRHYILTFYTNELYAPSSVYSSLLIPIPVVELKTNTENSEFLNNENALKIHLGQNNKIYINDTLINFNAVKQLVSKHIKDTLDLYETIKIQTDELEIKPLSNKIILFTTSRPASYDLYVKILDEIKYVYTTIRNEFALKEFGVSFQDLLLDKEGNKDKIKLVRELIPLQIIERDPIDY